MSESLQGCRNTLIFNSNLKSVLLYASKTWTIKEWMIGSASANRVTEKTDQKPILDQLRKENGTCLNTC